MAERYVERRAPMVRKPALILDVDETALSNWPQIEANDYGRIANGPCELPAGPCGQIAWQGRAEDEPIRPTLKLFQKAKAMGVAVFFITGRSEILRAATEANLRKVGYEGLGLRHHATRGNNYAIGRRFQSTRTRKDYGPGIHNHR